MVVGGVAAAGAVAVVAVEAGGRGAIEREVRGGLAEAGVTGDVDVVVGSAWWNPSVWPALLTGDLDRVHVTVRDGEMAGLPVSDADYVLEGLRGDLSVRSGTVDVEDLDAGRVRLLVDPAAIGRQVGLELEVRDGRLVDGSGRPVEAVVERDQLVFLGEGTTAEGATPGVTVVDPYLLPCPPRVSVEPGGLLLSCEGDELPGILRAPLAGTGDEPPPAEAVEDLPPPQTIERPGG